MTVDVRQLFAKALPVHAASLEQYVIAAVLIEPSILDALPTVETQDFFDMRHQALWSAIREVQALGADVNIHTVLDELERTGRLGSVARNRYLDELLTWPEGTLLFAKRAVEAAEILRKLRARRERLVAA